MSVPPALEELERRLTKVGWVSDLLVGGSLASGDYREGVSDLDLVAITDGPLGADRRAVVGDLHRDLDRGDARGLSLGCVYVPSGALADVRAEHPTWTHGRLVDRWLSTIARAELLQHGFAVFGRAPTELFAPMAVDDVRNAVRDELAGYWSRALRHPRVWLDPVLADLALTTMSRARHTLTTGQLVTKTAAIEGIDAPGRLVGQVRARRSGEDMSSPRLRTAVAAWRDTRRTVRAAGDRARG